jgi:peptide methionine sulfoxide reductase msrA/msrB
MRTRIFLIAVVLIAVAALWAQKVVKRNGHAQGGGANKEVQVRELTETGELSAPVAAKVLTKDDSDWRQALKPDRYKILREAGTERPFTGELLAEKRDGWYVCHACGLPLFKSTGKFESHCGWPSFSEPSAYENIKMRSDMSGGMMRTEILCARCNGHLGHVFEDGPTATGLRYCVNSLSLDFKALTPKTPTKTDTAIFAAGCFWGVEKLFHETPGVLATSVGYIGGHVEKPTYKQVCTGKTGHAEAVEVVFDPARVTFQQLTKLFFEAHDPTTLNAQGPDHGTQYRSGVFYQDAEQERIAREVRDELVAKKTWSDPVVTEIVKSTTFWKAEDYHQKWFLTHPVQCHRPKG